MYTVAPYERRHRQAVLDLIFYSTRAHIHLDWHDVGSWVETPQAITHLAWHDNDLAGIVALSVPVFQTAWLRLAGVSNPAPGHQVIPALWDSLVPLMTAQGCQTVHVLLVEDWLLKYIKDLGFEYREHIITLRRSGAHLPSINIHNIRIRSADHDDLATITAIDQTAFSSPWQMSAVEIRQAMRVATSATVALLDNTIVGYQISTLQNRNGHLARLAVHPRYQGQGIGAIIVHNLLERFLRRGIRTVTVNTQSGNLRSQRLYARFGFTRNSYDLPVWSIVASPPIR